MNGNRIPQLGPAVVLAQLISEHPELPPVEWNIRIHDGALHGVHYLADEPFELLRMYAEVLGGSIRPEPTENYTSGTRGEREMHELSARWRDVRIVVRVAVTVASVAVSA